MVRVDVVHQPSDRLIAADQAMAREDMKRRQELLQDQLRTTKHATNNNSQSILVPGRLMKYEDASNAAALGGLTRVDEGQGQARLAEKETKVNGHQSKMLVHTTAVATQSSSNTSNAAAQSVTSGNNFDDWYIV